MLPRSSPPCVESDTRCADGRPHRSCRTADRPSRSAYAGWRRARSGAKIVLSTVALMTLAMVVLGFGIQLLLARTAQNGTSTPS